MNEPTTKELVKRSVGYARYYRRRAHTHTDPAEAARLLDLSNHCMLLAKSLKAAAMKLRSY